MKRTAAILLIALAYCSGPKFNPDWTKERAPQTFTAHFETTKGNFDIEVTRQYSPKAADRFYQLVKHGYYDNAMFYRVVPDFVAQFGNTDQGQMQQWQSVKIPDEPVVLKNTEGTVSFAREGKDSRGAELFINLQDNPKLDTINFEGVRGFPAFGKVVKGMDVVRALYSGYGEKTMDDYELMYRDRGAFLRAYPKLDLIKAATPGN